MDSCTLKQPRTVAEQRSKLLAHGITFDGYSKKEVDQILLRTNYYRLTGYALQFRIDQSHGKCEAQTRLRDIIAIYDFDSALRNFILRYTEPVEIKLRTVIAYEYSNAHCLHKPHDQHLDAGNYYRKADAQRIIDAFSQEEHYLEEPLFIQHHLKKYGGKAPLWVMVETMPFSRLSKYYNCMYDGNRTRIAKHFRTSPDNLHNALQCIVRLRNESAHGNRIYNTRYMKKARLVFTALKETIEADSVFAYLTVLYMYQTKTCLKQQFMSDLQSILDRFDPVVVRRDLLGIPENGLRLVQRNIQR